MTDWRQKPADTPERRAAHAAQKLAERAAFLEANPGPQPRIAPWPYTLDNPSPASRRIAEQLKAARLPVGADVEMEAENG